MFPLIMMEYLLLVFALYLYQQTRGREGGSEGGRREGGERTNTINTLWIPSQAGGVLAPACGQAGGCGGWVEVTSSLL